MSRVVDLISGRRSLRPPQHEALSRLARILRVAPPSKDADVGAALAAIRAEYPSVVDFERDFPSLCFALATGVGKTRLMGAFIAYLYLEKRSRHFLVLAPNLTIYDKLERDFTPNTPKYVFQGIAEFAIEPPEIVTGDNYETGRGVRRTDLFGESAVHINIFNISKLNAEVRGGRAPRIKRLSECIGQSYFEYLAGLDDLVLIMDESHRYRADRGVQVLNELKPILGLELTATPQVEKGNKFEPFKNVVYGYPLGQAITDGFVKEPAVATRANFDVTDLDLEALERLKLEDGVLIHENTKVELEVFARQNELPLVKPFLLVVAKDTTHADHLKTWIQADAFFEGRYKHRVIQVDSSQSGEERDDNVSRQLAVERPDEPTEIVIHVNMLKEGWDVTTLDTIVPLRAADSKTLVEQSIGRGLRLPYGRRTGVAAVDRLTIVAHDRFQEIIDEANKSDSPIRFGTVVVGADVPSGPQQVVSVPSVVETLISPLRGADPVQQPILFPTPREQEIATATLQAIRDFERLPQSHALKTPEIQQQLVARVVEAIRPAQGEVPDDERLKQVAQVVAKVTEVFVDRSIDIPRIIVVPAGEVASGFKDFDLDTATIRHQPVAEEILIEHLRTHQRDTLHSEAGSAPENKPEDYVVRALMDHEDISYDDHSDLLYKLSGQLVSHLHSYLAKDEEVLNVLRYHQQPLARLVHTQMETHRWEEAKGYEVKVARGYTTLRPSAHSVARGEGVRDFRLPSPTGRSIRTLLFGGFKKCLYPSQRFDSDSERRFAVMLEDDREVLKWLKPAPGTFQIHLAGDRNYEPDFVVEMPDVKYLCEPKAAGEIEDREVLEKAQAALEWCRHASEHSRRYSGKPWQYLLIPHDEIEANRTMRGLAAAYTVTG